MNVAVVGKSDINKLLNDQLLAAGYTPVSIENTCEVTAFNGEAGNFSISTAQDTLQAGCVIFTEQVQTAKAYGDNREGSVSLPVISLLAADVSQIGKTKAMPIVFLMDYPTEAPAFMTRIALAEATKLVRKKRNVFYVVRFMRTAETGLDSLYREARAAGVVFVKYNQISVEYNQEEDLFTLLIAADYEQLKLSTNILISADKKIVSENIDQGVKVLKLKNITSGAAENNKNFLFPDYTNRKGVHVLNFAASEFQGEELALRIKSIVANVRNDLKQVTNDSYAEVDPVKCALCYTCYRACPHAAMVLDETSSAMKNLQNNCYACGICASVCPAGAISMIRPDQKKNINNKTGKLKIFCCENSGEIAVRKLYNQLLGDFYSIDIAAVTCGGDLNAEMILTALQDYGKVLVAVCIDDACKHFEGNKRAVRQVEKVKKMLDTANMDPSSVEIVKLSQAMPRVAFDCINSMV